MKTGIVILNYNGKVDTLACLKSLMQAKTSASFDIVVVDNGSKDNSAVEIKRQFSKVVVLANSDNLGFSEGNNVGIRYLLKREVDGIFILNNDTEVKNDCLTWLLKAANSNPKGGIFGPKIYFAKGTEFHYERYKLEELGKVIWYAGGIIDWDNVLASHRGVDEVDKGQYDTVGKTAFVSGCAMYIKKEVFAKAGFFDKKLFLYYEDVDLCMRASLAGFELYYVSQAVLWHKNAQTAQGVGSQLQSYYITRNRLLIGMRYAKWRTKLALLREAGTLLLRGNSTQRQAVGDFLRKKYGQKS